MRFSDRLGITTAASVLQTEGISDPLRNAVWNVLYSHFLGKTQFLQIYWEDGWQDPKVKAFGAAWWEHFLRLTVDTVPHYDLIAPKLRSAYFASPWYEAYNLAEFILQYHGSPQAAIADLNKVLSKEMAGYRYIGGQFVPVTAAEEVESVDESLNAMPYAGARSHIQAAVALLANKQNPDYRNSIKESISAIESIAREITGNPKATLGAALNSLEKKGAMHPALKQALSSLYGYTSDEGGIRHAMLEVSSLDAADAKFMLVVCSAFANYMKEKV